MNDLVGIIRKEEEITKALTLLGELWARYQKVQVEGHRQYNPGWNLAIDLRNMLLVSECVARAALERTESRGGHTRDDHPGMDANWRKTLLVCRVNNSEASGPHISITHEPQVPMRQDLLELFEISELEKYFTEEELAEHPGRSA
jgi:succinate dehydrogenase / fumarate reductase flavoprotein subunit